MSRPSAHRIPAPYCLPAALDGSLGASTFVGASRAIAATLRELGRLAPHDFLPVLIEGESGTGKSYVARAIHLGSPRARHTFHQVVLSTLDDNLAASDLFGHLSGAYTDARQNRPGHFVTANNGTLFLDEIGKASAAVQRKLLHAVEHHEVWPVGADRAVRLDVRLVAATNVPLETLVARAEFLPDLAARLINFRVRLPSLRERRADLPDLVDQFLRLRAPRLGYPGPPPRVSGELMAALQRADWPYNLRQLDATVQRLLIEAEGASELTLAHCPSDLRYLCDSAERGDGKPGPLTLAAIESAIARAGGNVSRAADLLGVDRTTLHRRRRLLTSSQAAPADPCVAAEGSASRTADRAIPRDPAVDRPLIAR